MANMKIELDGRLLVNSVVEEQTPTRIVTKDYYNDGTEVNYIQEAGEISVSSNRTMVVQSDGITVKLV